jgi:hypothetical protein
MVWGVKKNVNYAGLKQRYKNGHELLVLRENFFVLIDAVVC